MHRDKGKDGKRKRKWVKYSKKIVSGEERQVPYVCQLSAVQGNGGSVLVEVSLNHTHSLLHPHSSQLPMLSSPKQTLGREWSMCVCVLSWGSENVCKRERGCVSVCVFVWMCVTPATSPREEQEGGWEVTSQKKTRMSLNPPPPISNTHTGIHTLLLPPA